MIERKSKFREDVREENKVTEDDMEEKQRYRGRWRVKAKYQTMLESKSNITEDVREKK